MAVDSYPSAVCPVAPDTATFQSLKSIVFCGMLIRLKNGCEKTLSIIHQKLSSQLATSDVSAIRTTIKTKHAFGMLVNSFDGLIPKRWISFFIAASHGSEGYSIRGRTIPRPPDL